MRNAAPASLQHSRTRAPDAAWAVSDGHAGNARQAHALAAALGHAAAREITLTPGWLARRFAPRAWPGISAPFGPGFRGDCESPPALAIGCGRQAALATRLLRRAGARAVQILDPRIDPRHWDVVVVPEHDRLRGDSVVPMLGSLHPVDDLWLARGRAAFPALAQLPQPRVALLVGGPSAHWSMADADFAAVLRDVAGVVGARGGSLLATASRRTPAAWRRALGEAYSGLPGQCWMGEGDNPYAGFLGWADAIVCTPDSVNMLSEACATGVPVHVLDVEALHGRPAAFLHALRQRRHARAWDGTLQPCATVPLRETARVANAVAKRLAALR